MKHLALLLFLLWSAVACSGGGGGVGDSVIDDGAGDPRPSVPGGGGNPVDSTVDAISITSSGGSANPTLTVGKTQQAAVQALDAAGNPVTDATYVWTSSDSSVVEVANTGLITAKAPGGPVTISVKSGSVTQPVFTVIVSCTGIPSNVPTPLVVTFNPASPVSVNATTSVSLVVKDCTGIPVADNTLVTLSLTSAGLATLSNSALSTVGGAATTTITAGATAGVVTVSAMAGGIFNSANLTINALPADNIAFDSAIPALIGIKGSGKDEVSAVSFIVRNAQGNLVADGQTVKFAFLSGQNPGGGAVIDPAAASTVGGIAKTFLKSGSVAGALRIVAFLDANNNGAFDTGETFSTTTNLSIGGGVPSMKHFSVSVDPLNIAGLAYDGMEASVTVRLADRFSNTNILQGHAISFYTESGAIPTQAQADAAGVASVKLRSQNPRPADTDPRQIPNPIGNETMLYNGVSSGPYTLEAPNPRDGWVSILVVTKGEEAFSDANGNGVYDTGEPFEDSRGEPYLDINDNGIYDDKEVFDDLNFDAAWTPGEPFYDKGRGEPFHDTNGNGARDLTEPFTDIDGDFAYDGAGDAFYDADQDGIFDAGEPFKETNGVAGFQSGGFYDHVYNAGEFYVDTNQNGLWTHGNGVWDANIDIWTPTNAQSFSHKIAFTGGLHAGPDTSRIVINATPALRTYAVPNGGCVAITIYIADVNNNALIPGTKIAITLDEGKLLGQKEDTITNDFPDGPYVHQVSICDEDNVISVPPVPPKPSSLEVKVTWSPPGVAATVYTFPVVFGTVN